MASPFSGRPGRMASIAVGQFLSDGQADINKLIDQRELRSLRDIDKGYKTARGDYQSAIDLFNPYAETGGKAFQRYADATGVNGQEGYDRSVGNFRASPGYQWAVDQATDGVARKQSALGALGSGNTMAAISDRAGHMADQEYDDYLSRLDGIGKMGYDATGRQAALTQGIGDLSVNQGRDRAGIYQNSARLGVTSRMGTNQAMADALQGGMMAGQNAAANRWNMGMQGLKLLSDLGGKFAAGGF